MAEISGTTLRHNTPEETGSWIRGDRMFNEERSFRRMKQFAAEEGLVQTDRALDFMREKHAGQYRKTSIYAQEKVPYILHPLMMACHAHAMGIRDDEILSVILLHDVCEDCHIDPKDLPFSEQVQKSVGLLTFTVGDGEDRAQAREKYFDRIRTDGIACIVKLIDRCNNVSTMALGFERDRLVDYIHETEKYVFPLFLCIKRNYTEYYDAAFILKYHLLSVMESVKILLKEGYSNDT